MLIGPHIFLVGAILALATSPIAGAALLIEGDLDGKALRILVDTETSQAEVTFDQTRHLLDLRAKSARSVGPDGAVQELEVASADGQASPKAEIKPWGPGPVIAGHASVYHVMTLNQEICGELLISPWMKPFVKPAIEALAILERIKGDDGIRSARLKGACATLPFSSYAAAGWPLMAGGVDEPIFKTTAISFDYQPSESELNWAE
ncbi:MAG: hypothetical protein ACR2Q4_24115 [Geminicoccaceae bacterium]